MTDEATTERALRISCATGANPDKPVAAVTIAIGPQTIQEKHEELGVTDGEQAPIVFREEANRLASALCLSLPGGTLDALLAYLLQHKASHLYVPYGGPAQAEDVDELADTILELGLRGSDAEQSVVARAAEVIRQQVADPGDAALRASEAELRAARAEQEMTELRTLRIATEAELKFERKENTVLRQKLRMRPR